MKKISLFFVLSLIFILKAQSQEVQYGYYSNNYVNVSCSVEGSTLTYFIWKKNEPGVFNYETFTIESGGQIIAEIGDEAGPYPDALYQGNSRTGTIDISGYDLSTITYTVISETVFSDEDLSDYDEYISESGSLFYQE